MMKRAMIRGCLILLAGTWLLTGERTVHAYALDDHRSVTHQAVREFSVCYPGVLDDGDVGTLVRADLNEDLNLIRKWGRYSHFFNPEHPLRMRRRGSDRRIIDSVAELERALARKRRDREEILMVVGHMIHHLQDASAPPHVVPVNHWLTDGFESFESGKSPEPSEQESECGSWDSALPVGWSELLLETARETLRESRTDLIAFRNGTPVTLPWSVFWKEGQGEEFGEYGEAGNSFGDTSLYWGGKFYEVPVDQYRALKDRQLRLAIRVTKRALRHLVGL